MPQLSARGMAVIVLGLLSLAGTVMPDALAELGWQRAAIDAGQWSRLLTAHVVHLNAHHLWFNLLGLLLVAELLLEDWHGVAIASLCVASALGTSLMLWHCEPTLQWYAGLSGLLHGLWGGAALMGWLRTRACLPAGALLALAIKLFWLTPGVGAGAVALVQCMPVVPGAHLYGAASGLAWAMLSHLRRRYQHFD